jgi:hypothetical protein
MLIESIYNNNHTKRYVAQEHHIFTLIIGKYLLHILVLISLLVAFKSCRK